MVLDTINLEKIFNNPKSYSLEYFDNMNIDREFNKINIITNIKFDSIFNNIRYVILGIISLECDRNGIKVFIIRNKYIYQSEKYTSLDVYINLIFNNNNKTIDIVYKINDIEGTLTISYIEISKQSYIQFYDIDQYSTCISVKGKVSILYNIPTIIKNKGLFYSLELKDDNNTYIPFKNIEDISEDKYIEDLNNIISAKNIDNLYPMNIIIKK